MKKNMNMNMNMNKIALKKVSRLVALGGLVAAASLVLAAGCGPGYTPPAGLDKWTCWCNCETPPEFPKIVEATFCTEGNPCTGYCGSMTDSSTICNVEADKVVPQGCADGMSGQMDSGGEPEEKSNEVEIPDNNEALFTHFGENSSMSVRGAVMFTGGCQTGTCPIAFSLIYLWPTDFSVLGSNQQTINVRDAAIMNIASINVTSVDGEFTIPKEDISLLADADVGESHWARVFTPDQDVYGIYLPSTGVFRLSASLSSGEDLAVEFELESTTMSRPPKADAGDSQTVYADSGGSARVALDGSGSSDLDDDITGIEWYEGTTYLGAGTTPYVTFGVGTHNVTAYVIDEKGKWGAANTTVTVLP